jgi:hypothetical protein
MDEPDYDVDEDGFVGVEEGEYVRLRAIEQAAREALLVLDNVELHIKKLAFSMPAPNAYTPQFVSISVAMVPHVERLRLSLGER